MRRGCSLILFIIGGWFLSAVSVVGLIPKGAEISAWAMLALVVAFSLPFLLAGTWVSPGRRFAELGMTLMIVAGLALTTVVVFAAVWFDEAFKKLMPQPLPEFGFNLPIMAVSLISIGGTGYWLWRRSSASN